VEDIRERMKAETGLVVVGSADDQLRVGKTKKLMEGVTQSMIDRCILVSKRDVRKLSLYYADSFLSSSSALIVFSCRLYFLFITKYI
jgi:hypothetical protein